MTGAVIILIVAAIYCAAIPVSEGIIGPKTVLGKIFIYSISPAIIFAGALVLARFGGEEALRDVLNCLQNFARRAHHV